MALSSAVSGGIFYTPQSGPTYVNDNGSSSALQPAVGNGAMQNQGQVLGASTTQPSSGLTTAQANPNLANAINAEYNTTMNNLTGDMGQLQNIYGTQQNDLGQQYTAQYNPLVDQYGQGQAALTANQTTLNQSKSNSLRDLNNQLALQRQSYANNLGVMGAGNSSADAMIARALGNEGARNTGDIYQQAGNQQTAINNQQNALNQNYQDQVAALQQWKQQSLNQLAANYAQQMKQYQDAMTQAQGNKAAALGIYGQGDAANQALAQLQALDAQYSNAQANLDAAYGAAPNSNLSQYTNGVQINPLSAPQLQAVQQSPAAQTAPTYTGLSLKQNQQPSLF